MVLCTKHQKIAFRLYHEFKNGHLHLKEPDEATARKERKCQVCGAETKPELEVPEKLKRW